MIAPLAEEFNVDLSRLPAAQWPRYFFDRTKAEGLFGDYFEGEDAVTYEISDGSAALAALTDLLLNFRRYHVYTLEQVNQGVWAMWGPEYELDRLFWDEGLPWPERERAIQAMAVPFRDFLLGHPAEVMENCFFMWWDLIRAKPPFMGSAADVARVKGTYLETLREILALDDPRCKEAALHGLGHLYHPERAATVQAFIDAQTDLEQHPDGRRWLEQCRDGSVM